jgi:hypothetical protein
VYTTIDGLTSLPLRGVIALHRSRNARHLRLPGGDVPEDTRAFVVVAPLRVAGRKVVARKEPCVYIALMGARHGQVDVDPEPSPPTIEAREQEALDLLTSMGFDMERAPRKPAALKPSPVKLPRATRIAELPKRKKKKLTRVELVDVEATQRAGVPTRRARSTVRVNETVKLGFVADGRNEFIWVIVREAKNGRYVGEVNNRPISVPGLALGDELAFGPEHIDTIF